MTENFEQKNVSMIIPFYNEMLSIPFFKKKMVSYINSENKWVNEIILVNDGSTDETLKYLYEIAEQWNKETEVEIVVNNVQPNKGKGNALKQGVQQATGSWFLTLDADLATLPNQLDNWIKSKQVDLNNTEQVYIGSRELGIMMDWVEFKWHRRIVGRIFALLVRIFSGLKLSDSQCGYKLYPRKVAQIGFDNLVDMGFAHDVEVLYRIKKAGYNITSLPVRWVDRGDSKVHLIKDSINMFVQLINLKKNVV